MQTVAASTGFQQHGSCCLGGSLCLCALVCDSIVGAVCEMYCVLSIQLCIVCATHWCPGSRLAAVWEGDCAGANSRQWITACASLSVRVVGCCYCSHDACLVVDNMWWFSLQHWFAAVDSRDMLYGCGNVPLLALKRTMLCCSSCMNYQGY
jgi:hypothetical protein